MGGPLTAASGDPADLDHCHLTTRGRVSGRAHEIEIWFALEDGIVYVLSGDGERSDWVKNLIADPAVMLRLGDETREASARVVSDPEQDELARRLLVEKYRSRYSGDLEGWRRTALPISIAWDRARPGN